MKNIKIVLLLLAMVLIAAGCSFKYRLNGASIDYNLIKTITIESFTNRASYQWAPMAPMFNETLSDIYNRQTKLRQVKRDGDRVISGEITAF